MQAMIDELAKQAEESLGQVSSKETLATFWQEYLSKNGKIPALMKNLRSVAPEERPAMGKIINELKARVQAEYDAAADKVKQAELAARNAAETVDITLPAKTRAVGGLHPLTLVTNQIIDVFSGMGFAVADAPEIEDDDHNFTRLNVPKDHPARDMQDTFYLSDEFLLRTQKDILDAVAPMVKVGGTLVYSTCSILPQENEEQIRAFLERHPEYEIQPMGAELPEKLAAHENALGLQMFAHRDGTDGFYVCRMRRVKA